VDTKNNIEYIKFDYCGHIPTTESFPKMLDEMVKFIKEKA
jgi:hypothetical protein